MAGIGFELRRLVATRTIGGFAAAAVSGAILVAGPWLISAASVAALQRLPFLADPAEGAMFTGAMVWAFALSIVSTTGPLYIFVRLSADLIYEHRESEASFLLLRVAALLAALSLPLGYGVAFLLTPSLPRPGLFRSSFALLFASVNVLWAAMMTATALKRPLVVLASYVLGMAALYGLGTALGPRYGAAGGLAALALGYALTALGVLAAVVIEKRPRRLVGAGGLLLAYAKRYRNLMAAGFLYALGTWCDKFFLWALKGRAPAGTVLLSHPSYDLAFFYASLAMIPGLIYFTIATEVDLHLDLSRFVIYLGRRRYPDLESSRLRLIAGTRRSIRNQSLFQLAAIAVAALIVPFLGDPASPLLLLLAASFFQLLLLTALNLQFYLELYRYAVLTVAVFVLFDVALSLAPLVGLALPDGVAYLSGCAGGAILGLALAFRGLDMADRLLYVRASGDDYGR